MEEGVVAKQSDEQPSFVVLSVYNSSPELRQKFVELMQEFVETQALVRPGLCSFDIFTDEGGGRIVTLARWRDRKAFEDFKQSEVGRDAAEVGLVLRPTVYFLRPEAAPAEVTSSYPIAS